MDPGHFGLGFVSGHLAGHVRELTENTEVGQGAEAGIQVADPAVAPRHAQIYAQEGVLYLLDLNSPGGTFLDGSPIAPGTPHLLQPGALLRFGENGPVALLHRLPRLKRSAETVLERTDRPASWSLSGPVLLGSAEDCEIRLDAANPLAAPQHLHLLPAFGHLIATDLGSPNGTWTQTGRLVQRALPPGEAIVLGGEGGPTFRLRPPDLPLTQSLSWSAAESGVRPIPVPELFVLEMSAGGETGQVLVGMKPEISFGSFAGINDFDTVCFPRDLEDESDAMERSEAIGPQHGALVLRESDVAIRDEGYAETSLDGVAVPPDELVGLPDAFQLDLAGGILCFRGRVLRHPGLPPRSPAFGVEHNHPVECLTLERMGDGPESRLYMLLVRQAAIGSSEDAAICVEAAGVGALHALLYVQDEALWLTQLGPDPIAVDGVPLSPQTTVPLGVGSEAFIGTVRLRVLELD